MSADLVRIYHDPITTFQDEYWLIDGIWVEIVRFYNLRYSTLGPDWSAIFVVFDEVADYTYHYSNCRGCYCYQNREVVVDRADDFSKDLIDEIISVFAPPFEEVEVTYEWAFNLILKPLKSPPS